MEDTKKHRVLIIEDEKNLARFVDLELQHEGYETAICHDGRKGLETALNQEWDVILLDLMLPELNGLEVCRRIRPIKDTPIIIMTARDSVIDRVSGLDQGADDYIVKPFAIEELLARLRALFRRIDHNKEEKNQSQQSSVKYRNLVIEKKGRIVKRDDQVIDLTKRESREVLLDKVWGYKTEVETNVVDVYIRYLRNKIDVPGKDSYIQTVRGTGYVMRT